MEVGNPDAGVSFPGQAGQIPCGVLENMGEIGLIPPPQCDVLPQLISTVCECQPFNPTTTGATVGPATTTTTEATKPGSSYSMSVSSKGAKSLTSKSTKVLKSKSTKCYAQESEKPIAISHVVSGAAASTSSEFNSEDLIILLRWIVYTSEAASPLAKEERAEQVDSLGTQTNQEGANEVEVGVLEDIRAQLVELNENFKNMGE